VLELARIAGPAKGRFGERRSLAPRSPVGIGGLTLVTAQGIPAWSVVDLRGYLAGTSVDVLVRAPTSTRAVVHAVVLLE
jgi:hypothetical protein